jgi:chromosome segregation ATPase
MPLDNAFRSSEQLVEWKVPLKQKKMRSSLRQVAIGSFKDSYNCLARRPVASNDDTTDTSSCDSGDGFEQRGIVGLLKRDVGERSSETTDEDSWDGSITSNEEQPEQEHVHSDDERITMNDTQLTTESSYSTVVQAANCCTTRKDRMIGMHNLIAELTRLKVHIDSEVTNANGVMEVIDSNLDTLKSENKALIEKIEVLTNQIATIESRKKKLGMFVEEMTGQIANVGQEMAILISLLEKKGDENQELQQVIKDKQHEILLLSHAKSDIESRLNEKEEEDIKLNASLLDCRMESKEKALKIENLTKLNVSLLEDVSSLQVSNKDMQEALISLTVALLEAEIENAALFKEEENAAAAAWTKSEVVGLLDTERQLLEYKERAMGQLKSLQDNLTKV